MFSGGFAELPSDTRDRSKRSITPANGLESGYLTGETESREVMIVVGGSAIPPASRGNVTHGKNVATLKSASARTRGSRSCDDRDDVRKETSPVVASAAAAGEFFVNVRRASGDRGESNPMSPNVIRRQGTLAPDSATRAVSIGSVAITRVAPRVVAPHSRFTCSKVSGTPLR